MLLKSFGDPRARYCVKFILPVSHDSSSLIFETVLMYCNTRRVVAKVLFTFRKATQCCTKESPYLTYRWIAFRCAYLIVTDRFGKFFLRKPLRFWRRYRFGL